MKKRSFLSEHTFQEYIAFLSDSMLFLEEYKTKIGCYKNHVTDVRKALENGDPFVTYKASIAATLLLADNSLYH
jgi:hypothetical protein